ncbi:MAG: hypothetical protein IPK67_18415 [Planctomycetes bacterium]|nr:hypothetical protein [Planctomycetota bacterium]
MRELKDEDISALNSLKNLTYLSFAAGWGSIQTAPITDAGLARLAALELPRLRTLDIGSCAKITDAGLVAISSMEQVEELLLDSTSVSDLGLASLIKMEQLTYLDLRRCGAITDRGLEVLATKNNWKTLMLGGCYRLTESGVSRLKAALPECSIFTTLN